MFLSDEELQEMTGLIRGADQARWFRNHGYYVECNTRGKPRITHAQVEQRRQVDKPATTNQNTSEPNILAFRQKLQSKHR
jgi:hypothetical protein